MSKVRVLVGTRKGAFILSADGKREKWEVSGPHFAGWEIYHLKGSPADPNRLYASQTSGWFGQIIQRSSDGGKTWETPGGGLKPPSTRAACRAARATNSPMTPLPRPASLLPRINGMTARSIPGNSSASGISSLRSPIRTRSTREWKTPRCSAPRTAPRPGTSSPDCAATAPDPSGNRAPAACACTPSFSIRRIPSGSTSRFPLRAHFAPTTAAKPGSRSTRDCARSTFPIPTAEVGHCVHHIAMQPETSRRAVHAETLGRDAQRQRRRLVARGQRKFAHRLRLRDRRSRPRAGNRSTSSRSRATPSISRSKASCASTAAARGGNEWEPLTKGLPQNDCYVNVLRDAMAVDSLDSCGVYFGTTGGQVYASTDAGDNWSPIVHESSRRALRRGADAAMIQVVQGAVRFAATAPRGAVRDVNVAPRPLARHLRFSGTYRRDLFCRERQRAARHLVFSAEVESSPYPSHTPGASANARGRRQRDFDRSERRRSPRGPFWTRSKRAIRCFAVPSAITSRYKRRPFLRFFACQEDLSLESPDAPLPDAVSSGKEPFMIIGAIAGG